MTYQSKHILRSTYCKVREKLPLDYQQKISSQVCARIRQLELYRYAKHVAFYHAYRGEIDLRDLWYPAPMQGKFCYFPVINMATKKLSFLPVTRNTLFKKNCYGILEPDVDPSHVFPIKKLDLIFMPLVAFDDHGTRIGMGGGYYDRTLEKEQHPMLLGVAYEFQHRTYLVPDEWDISLTAIITQKSIYWIRSQ